MSALLLALLLNTAPSAAPIPDRPFVIDTAGTSNAVKAGKQGTFKIEIKPAAGYKVSREAPLKIELSATGLELAKASLGQADSDDAKTTSPRFKVDFTAKAKGKQNIAANATFFVCNETLCERKTAQVTVAVAVDP